jgi:Virulence activator alpha C-term
VPVGDQVGNPPGLLEAVGHLPTRRNSKQVQRPAGRRDRDAAHLRDGLLAGRSEGEYLRAAARVGPYLTLMAGRMYERQNIRWCTIVLEALERRGVEVHE